MLALGRVKLVVLVTAIITLCLSTGTFWYAWRHCQESRKGPQCRHDCNSTFGRALQTTNTSTNAVFAYETMREFTAKDSRSLLLLLLLLHLWGFSIICGKTTRFSIDRSKSTDMEIEKGMLKQPGAQKNSQTSNSSWCSWSFHQGMIRKYLW